MTLEHNLDQLDAWLQTALESMTPQAQNQLLRKIGRELRKRTVQNLRAQRSPEGERWAPRKNESLVRAPMMRKLRTPARLRQQVARGELRLGWRGRDAHLAKIHHYGLRDKLQYGIAQYPARELIGFTAADAALIRTLILEHVGGNP